MQWKGKIVSAGQRNIFSYQFLVIISVIYLPVSISQQVFGLCKKDFEDINSSLVYSYVPNKQGRGKGGGGQNK